MFCSADCLLIERATLVYLVCEYNKQFLRMKYELYHMLDVFNKKIQRCGICLKDLPIYLSHIVSRVIVI